MNFKTFFGFKKMPFDNDILLDDLIKLPGMTMAKERVDYILACGGVAVLTGELGSGKSTSLRWSLSQYHPNQYKIINLVGHGGTSIDFYRQLCWGIGIDIFGISRSLLIKNFKTAARDIVQAKKQKILLAIDEAQLLRSDVFAELHTITQFDHDSKNFVSVVLSGQSGVLDKLSLRGSAPLASRVIAKVHLSGINRDQMQEYLNHHTKICGNKVSLFADNATTAIQQGSAGILRKANSLARGGLIAAAAEKQEMVSAEHIRIAASELVT